MNRQAQNKETTLNLQSNILLIVLFIFSAPAFSTDLQGQLDAEVNQFITELEQAEGSDLVDISNRITSSGLSDKRLFDNVKNIILTKHIDIMSKSKNEELVIRQVVALLRTLASSGNYEYSSTLERLVLESSNRSIRNRAKHVMNKIGFYQQRNQLMQNLEGHSNSQSLHTTRILNLLESDDLIMNRFAAEEIFRAGSAAPVVQEWIATRLKRDLHNAESKLHIDTLAWYCKVLGLVNKPKYSGFLKEIVKDKSVDSKIRKHTKKILKS